MEKWLLAAFALFSLICTIKCLYLLKYMYTKFKHRNKGKKYSKIPLDSLYESQTLQKQHMLTYKKKRNIET